MTDQQLWEAARRLTSTFASGHADTFLDIVSEIDAADGWMVVALALNSDVSSLAFQLHGERAQEWLDDRLAQQLDRNARRGR